uniref:(northern house mosquito) hypothetical protein n=1 Tax=Culex pipiens TaxID=7175 RepID=A0A8D8FP42_CULPI
MVPSHLGRIGGPSEFAVGRTDRAWGWWELVVVVFQGQLVQGQRNLRVLLNRGRWKFVGNLSLSAWLLAIVVGNVAVDQPSIAVSWSSGDIGVGHVSFVELGRGVLVDRSVRLATLHLNVHNPLVVLQRFLLLLQLYRIVQRDLPDAHLPRGGASRSGRRVGVRMLLTGLTQQCRVGRFAVPFDVGTLRNLRRDGRRGRLLRLWRHCRSLLAHHNHPRQGTTVR